MRSVAQRLSSSTATLHRHFPNRAALEDEFAFGSELMLDGLGATLEGLS